MQHKYCHSFFLRNFQQKFHMLSTWRMPAGRQSASRCVMVLFTTREGKRLTSVRIACFSSPVVWGLVLRTRALRNSQNRAHGVQNQRLRGRVRAPPWGWHEIQASTWNLILNPSPHIFAKVFFTTSVHQQVDFAWKMLKFLTASSQQHKHSFYRGKI